ncbi:unnamed protein product [Musa banksii]
MIIKALANTLLKSFVHLQKKSIVPIGFYPLVCETSSIKASHSYQTTYVVRGSNNTSSRIRYFVQTSKRNLQKILNLCCQK